jgi:hypothetical protein
MKLSHIYLESLADAVFAARVMPLDVDVHVVGVERIDAGTQDRREPAARGRP